MSSQWYFYSFSKERWDAIFGGGLEGAEEKVIQSVTWDRGAWNDERVPIRLAQTIVKKGISYDGLSARQAEYLDKVITGFFCPEGLEDLLRYEPESPEGLSTSIVNALVDRAGNATLVHYLLIGRHYNASGVKISDKMLEAVLESLDNSMDRVAMEQQARALLAETPTASNRYLVLAPEEISRLHDEIASAIARPRPWPHPSYEVTARTCLLGTLTSAQNKKRWLAGRLN